MQRARDMKAKQRGELLRALKARLEKNINRHKGLAWAKVQAKLEANTEKLWSFSEMAAVDFSEQRSSLFFSKTDIHSSVAMLMIADCK